MRSVKGSQVRISGPTDTRCEAMRASSAGHGLCWRHPGSERAKAVTGTTGTVVTSPGAKCLRAKRFSLRPDRSRRRAPDAASPVMIGWSANPLRHGPVPSSRRSVRSALRTPEIPLHRSRALRRLAACVGGSGLVLVGHGIAWRIHGRTKQETRLPGDWRAPEEPTGPEKRGRKAGL